MAVDPYIFSPPEQSFIKAREEAMLWYSKLNQYSNITKTLAINGWAPGYPNNANNWTEAQIDDFISKMDTMFEISRAYYNNTIIFGYTKPEGAITDFESGISQFPQRIKDFYKQKINSFLN